MANIFDEILQEVRTLNSRIDQLEKSKSSEPKKILLSDFCREQNISRPTAYAWRDSGLIQFEKIGGRNFIPKDSITYKKYQRRELA